MTESSVIKGQQFHTPLSELTGMLPKTKKSSKNVLAEVSVTSLVDVFVILVVYLLVTTTPGSETLDLDKNINLPAAKNGEFFKSAPVVKILNGKYFLDEQPIEVNEIPGRLAELNRNATPVVGSENRPELIIQADKSVNFAAINPIIVGSSNVGFYKIKFAVINEGI